jgi:hypothetical protein
MLDDARRMVESKRFVCPPHAYRSGDPALTESWCMCRTADTIDLHGTTIAEAVTIMSEILDREGVSKRQFRHSSHSMRKR